MRVSSCRVFPAGEGGVGARGGGHTGAVAEATTLAREKGGKGGGRSERGRVGEGWINTGGRHVSWKGNAS